MKIFLCSHLVMLRWSGGETAANLDQISAAAAIVNAEEPLAVGAAVRILCDRYEANGVVSNCEIDPLGYFIEIALSEPWSPEIFRPDHFFDPVF
jgi:hypothetical protein